MSLTVGVDRKEFCNVLAFRLAKTWLASRLRIAQILRRALGRFPKWCEQLSVELHEEYGDAQYASQRELRRFLDKSRILRGVFRGKRKLQVNQAFKESLSGHRWDAPEARTDEQLRDLLCLSSHDALDWLLKPHFVRETKVDHYRRHLVRKPGGQYRLIEEPRPLLKRVQRTIAEHILPLAPIHAAAHGFVPGRSVFTAAAVHCGKRLVLCMDLADFFGSIDRRRAGALFKMFGYPWRVASKLSCLCTAPPKEVFLQQGKTSNSLPSERQICKAERSSWVGGSRLPQGAPTSPGIANAVAYRFDQRIAGLASSVGAEYTRYADDLTLSGDAQFVRSVARVIPLIGAIAIEEGFAVNYRKTRRMYSGHRQTVLGLTVNHTPAASRNAFEQLKAILYNCGRYGPQSQNRDEIVNFREHLRGRISFVGAAHSSRAKKLKDLFDKIQWDESEAD